MGDVGSRGKVRMEEKVDSLPILMDLIEKDWTMNEKSVSATHEMGALYTKTRS